MREHFTPVFVEKDDELELVERFGVTYFPSVVWTTADGTALTVSAQPDSAEEVLEEFAYALEEAQVAEATREDGEAAPAPDDESETGLGDRTE